MTLAEGANPAHLFTDLEAGDGAGDLIDSVYAFFVFREIEDPDADELEDDGKPDEADPTCSEFRP